ncbi:MAG: hypothetical protein WCV86_01930 [Patescibacteria group bacterium]
MEKKIQYKFPIEDVVVLEQRLQDKGITLTDPVAHEYTYYELPKAGGAFTVLRLKVSQGKAAVDMKIRNDANGEWQHFECAVDDAVQVDAILTNIGCKKIVTFHKTRRTNIGDVLRLDLDSTPEAGTFLEVKFSAEKQHEAEEQLRAVGIDPGTHDKRSVLEIYMMKKGSR